ncbi:MAG: sigma-54 dependent transcriptional regulator, partial [Spirochaetota bacterium]
FVFLTAQDQGEDAARGLALGALDYIRKPFTGAEFVARVRGILGRTLAARARLSEMPTAGQSLGSTVPRERRETVYRKILGKSRAIEAAIALLDRAAAFDAAVLLLGASGSGKELFARAFHEANGRGTKPFVAVNCAAVPRELAEGLFFGHAKGSFTGAQADRPGWFEEAKAGTLFLDEVGELPLELQGALLRAVESRKIRRLGESGERDLDIRLVAATNRDLGEAVKRGSFRADLYYRLEEIPIHVPSLAERREDIPILAEAFLAEFSELSPLGRIELSRPALEELARRPWPGNVRELRNAMRRIVISAPTNFIEGLPEAQASVPEAPGAGQAAPGAGQAAPGAGQAASAAVQAPPTAVPEVPEAAVQPAADSCGEAKSSEEESTAQDDPRLSDLEKAAIDRALAVAGGDVGAAAVQLGISRATLYRRLKSYRSGISRASGSLQA